MKTTIYNENIYALAMDNEYFRREIVTNENSQLVLMSVEPGDEIGEETHQTDQIIVFVSGTGEAILDGKRSIVGTNNIVVIPAGTLHNFINTGSEPMKLFTIYSPPEEPVGTVHKTKAEALAAEAAHHGKNGGHQKHPPEISH